jgi:hypothetical protein
MNGGTMSLPQAGAVTGAVRAWEDDPGAPPSRRTPVLRPRPDLARKPLPVGIASAPPTPDSSQVGTAEFRYWNLAEALRRTADFWGSLMPAETTWHSTVGQALQATPDSGDDLNAYYDREGLRFFHHTVGGITVYSGESPDVVCHETGHAVLDALQPHLWDAASAEVAAFHESFADISAILSGLQLESLRVEMMAETNGRISRSSQMSRLAEQLGWAIRQISPNAVDPDCLRNAANQFFYRDPVGLPPSAPAAELSSEPHSFSRVFTGAALRALDGIFQCQPTRDANALHQASIDIGRLLVAAVSAAPVVPAYYAQVAAHMLTADQQLFSGRYGRALRAAFVRHGILSPSAAAGLTPQVMAPQAASIFGEAQPELAGLTTMTMPGESYGITQAFSVRVPTNQGRFAVASAATDTGSLPLGDGERIAMSFVEDLFRQGRVAVAEQYLTDSTPVAEDSRLRTHEIAQRDGGLALVRRLVD